MESPLSENQCFKLYAQVHFWRMLLFNDRPMTNLLLEKISTNGSGGPLYENLRICAWHSPCLETFEAP